MSEKKKTTTTKKPAAKKTTAAKKSTAKKPATKKSTSTTKKTTTSKAKKPTSKSTTTKPKTATKSKTTTKKTAKDKIKVIKAQITSYRRDNRLQNTNQAIAKLLDDYNHKALLGKKFVLKFSNSDKELKGKVIAVHGQPRSKQVRITFDDGGVTAHAMNKIIEIYA